MRASYRVGSLEEISLRAVGSRARQRGPETAGFAEGTLHETTSASMTQVVPSRELFRREAVAHHAAARREGDILRLDARWQGWTYHLVWIVTLAALAFVGVASVHDYATGPAVVRVDGRRTLTATIPATVEEVLVRPGQQVTAG